MNLLSAKLEEWFESVSQYAKRNNVSKQYVRKQISKGRIIASKIGKTWVVAKNGDIYNYQKRGNK